ncbi:970_t:CDS:2, partial [Dentiscutata erythropus]
ESKRDKLQSELINVKIELDNKSKELENSTNFEKEKDTLSKRLEEHQNGMKTFMTEFASERESWRQKEEDLISNYECELMEKDLEVKEWNEKYKKVIRDCENSRERVITFERKVSEAEKTISNLREQIKIMERSQREEKEKLKRRHEEAISNLREQIKIMERSQREETETFNKQVSLRMENNNSTIMKFQITELEKQIEAVKVECDMWKKELSKHKTNYSLAAYENDVLSKEKSELNRKVDSLEKELKELSNVRQLEGKICSPHFETMPNVSWQLGFVLESPNDPEYCAIYLHAICNTDEIEEYDPLRNDCLPALLYIKRLDGTFIKQMITSSRFQFKSVKIRRLRMAQFCKREFLTDSIIMGVRLRRTKLLDQFDKSLNIPKKSIQLRSVPRNLEVAWNNEFKRAGSGDVKITVQGQTIYASSTILAKRSDYFQRMFQGTWFELIQMLLYLYTDQVELSECTNIWDLYTISNKYLITDLELKAKAKIIEDINFFNAAEGLFGNAWKWPELKKKFLKFVVKHFHNVRNSPGYKYIVTNQSKYPMYLEINTEILLNLVPEATTSSSC